MYRDTLKRLNEATTSSSRDEMLFTTDGKFGTKETVDFCLSKLGGRIVSIPSDKLRRGETYRLTIEFSYGESYG